MKLYYEVWVSGQNFHGSEPLTYEYESMLLAGTIVSVPLQRRTTLGLIHREVPAPKFATKSFSKVITDISLPPQLEQLFTWLISYYPAPLGPLMSLFLPPGLQQSSRRPADVSVVKKAAKPSPLTEEQQSALKQINSADSHSILLHGDTGTGKTRLYIELVMEQLKAGRSALVLTPEIGLTPQLAQTFEDAFPGQVTILHSTLTPAARRDKWLKVLNNQLPQVVIGPRSALFSPVARLGLIVIDECHDSAYKQEQTPYYQTVRVAAQLAKLHSAKLILGSATPSIADYYAFKEKGLPIVRMTTPAIVSDHGLPTIQTISLLERQNFTRSNWLSTTLIEKISNALAEGGQSLIFLNRRGTARLVLCQGCGWQSTCPRCDLPLTYHGDTHRLRCHTCGHAETAPSACPTCQSTDIIFKSVGTKTLFAELERLFPKARIARFDSDTKKSDRLEEQYTELKDGTIDILIGTQMLGKGLDLPKLQLLGIVIADTSLSFPDYTAEERTFQQLTQVIGRVGRGHRKGEIIIQSYAPEGLVIKSAINKDYDALYQSQIAERKTFDFPPFCHLLKLSCSRASRSGAMTAATKLADKLSNSGLRIHVTGPSPAFIEKNNNSYVWQLVIRSRARDELVKVVQQLPAKWTADLDPSNLL